MNEEFLKQTSQIIYSKDEYSKVPCEGLNEIVLPKEGELIHWINTYGIYFQEEMREVIKSNTLDDFLVKLIMDSNHTTKVIELEDALFVAVRVLKTETLNFDSEQMLFIVSPLFIWSIQEKKGDYFGWIRERLANNLGMVRKRKSDYLLFLLLESMVDNYTNQFHKYADSVLEKLNTRTINPTPEMTLEIEDAKQDLLKFKRASANLRDAFVKLEKVEIFGRKTKYYGELKEQINHLISDIDFELQELESKINLVFSLQGHRLNEVMKTLTIFSVIFIPLTFLAGIYGMNFENIPELHTPYGYFVLLGVMVLVTLGCVWYFKRKKWF